MSECECFRRMENEGGVSRAREVDVGRKLKEKVRGVIS